MLPAIRSASSRHPLPRPAPDILVIDDNEVFRGTIARALRRRSFTVHEAADAEAALAMASTHQPALAILDLNFGPGKTTGLQLIAPLIETNSAMRIVVLTGYASIATAVEAVKLGATNYLAKPASIEDILWSLGSVAEPAPGSSEPESAPLSVRQLEWEHLQRVLLDYDGNISAAARALGLHRRSLQRKLRKHAPT